LKFNSQNQDDMIQTKFISFFFSSFRFGLYWKLC